MFFGSDKFQSTAGRCIEVIEAARVRALNNEPDDDDFNFRGALGIILREMRTAANEFDERCKLSIATIGEMFVASLDAAWRSPNDLGSWQELYVSAYRFLIEYHVSQVEEPKSALKLVLQDGALNLSGFSDGHKRQILWAQTQVPMEAMRSVLHDDRINELRNARRTYDGISTVTKDAADALRAQEEKVQTLRNELNKLEEGFNFVGLVDGFRSLLKVRRKSRVLVVLALLFIAAVAVAPILYELTYIRDVIAAWFEARDACLKRGVALDCGTGPVALWPLAFLAPGLIAIEILIIYFFRIFLSQLRSLDAQILQLELRASLCQFIQSYAQYASTLKAQSGTTLDRFEALIFSGIQSVEDKIPTTFDGMDQIASLVEKLKK